MKRLFLVALALVVLLVVPANAYDTIWTDTLIGVNAGDANVDRLYFGNATLAGLEQWHITVVGHDAYTTNASFPTSGTTNVSLIDPTTSQARGNATFTWFMDYPDWAFTWDIIDLTPSDPTHLQYLPSNAVYNYIIGNGLQTISQSRQTGLETNEHSFYQGQFNGYYAGGMNGTVYTVSTGTPFGNTTPDECNSAIPPGYVRTKVMCLDIQTNGAIGGCDIQILDKEDETWSNKTDVENGIWCIDTFPLHHIDGYGQEPGYTDGERTDLPVSSSVIYALPMIPGWIPNATVGKVWVYVYVNDADTMSPMEGASVNVRGTQQGAISLTTDGSGSVHFQWANATTIYVGVTKSGYDPITRTLVISDFGPDSIRVGLHRSTVTPTATATTGPGGTVPTTVNPNGPVNGVYPSDYTSTQGQAIMNLLAYHGYDLVLLCIFVTMLALLGFKLGK